MTKLRRPSHTTTIAVLGLAGLCATALGDVIFAPGAVVLSYEEADTYLYFAHARAFAAAEVLDGNLPLWNPHVFAGQPFFGGFQSALLYPVNVLYLLAPLDWAINLDVLLHVFLMGLFGMLWARGRGLGPLAAFYAGAVMMLCGALTMRVLAGQLTVLAAACWTPAILAVAERLARRPTLGWTLAGIAAVTLQLLAGYPFYLYVTALLVGLVLAPRLLRVRPDPRVWASLAVVALGPIALGAAQLWTGLDTASESMRAGGVPFWFGASFSLPPENWLTAVAPTFFGDLPRSRYWGGSVYWDACLFLGVTTVVLALFGARFGARETRRGALAIAALMGVLALGEHAPVYRWFFDWVPGFDSFRAPSKFALQASLFVALLAGAGLDRMIQSDAGARLGVWASGVLSVGLLGLGGWLTVQAAAGPEAGAFGDWARRITVSEKVLDRADDPALLALAAAVAVVVAAATALGVAVLFAWRRRSPNAALCLAGLGIAEVWLFSATHHGEFALQDLERPQLERFYRETAGTDRVLDVNGRNHATAYRGLSVWGYDPVQLGRYGRFAASLQYRGLRRQIESDPDLQIPLVPKLANYTALLRLVRCRWIVEDSSFQVPPIEKPGAWPRALLLGRAEVADEASILERLHQPGFDPRRVALVESALDPPPEPAGARGRAFVGDESTDHVTLDVEAPAPALLVLSDSYSKGWKATLEGSGRALDVVPVHSFLIGVPLPEGRHRVRLEYAPASFRRGRSVSLAALAVYGAAVVVWGIRSSRRARSTGSPP